MKVIGFANVYFTGWEVTETIVNGYKITNYQYIKNLSKDFAEAQRKFGSTQYDASLKGKNRSFQTTLKIEYSKDKFNFGKYEGQKFSENKDYNYMAWYYENDHNPERRANIKPILLEKGYHFKELSNNDVQILNPKQWEANQILAKRFAEAENKLKNKENIDFIAEASLDEFGATMHNDITYYFANYQEMSYNGYFYSLPTINGKAKRIKNKKIVILNYEVIDIKNRTVKVLDFKIEKI